MNTINWLEQWELHSPMFKNGLAHIPLPGDELLLKPGPGFGDFSHPTTRLMIQLMIPLIKNEPILDIGSGSGILSLAAAKLGAQSIQGYDICRDAIEHAKENAALNKIKASYKHSSEYTHPKKSPIVFMNMILSEQIIAWKAYTPSFNKLITSGVLAEDREHYIDFASRQGWKLVKEKEEEGWMGFIFS